MGREICRENIRAARSEMVEEKRGEESRGEEKEKKREREECVGVIPTGIRDAYFIPSRVALYGGGWGSGGPDN